MANVPTAHKSVARESNNAPESKSSLLHWQADSFVHYARGIDWHIGVVFVGAAVISLMVILRDQLQVSLWLAVPMVAVAVAVLISRGVAKPHSLQYKLSDSGVVTDGRLMTFDHFRAYSINQYDNHAVLRLWTKSRFHLPISVTLNEVNLDEVRALILPILPEQEDSTNLSDQISHFFRM